MEHSQYEKARYYYQSISQLKEIQNSLHQVITARKNNAGITESNSGEVAAEAKNKSNKQFINVSETIDYKIDEAIKNLESEIEKL